MAVTTDFFPRPRLARAAAGGLAAGLAPPRTRVFPFSFSAPVNERHTRSSPVLRGPALIQQVSYHFGTPAEVDAVSRAFLEIGYATSNVSETAVDINAPRAWQSAFEVISGNTAQHPLNRPGIGNAGTTTPATSRDVVDLTIPVLLPEWFLVLSFTSLISSRTMNGTIIVLEGVSEEALANFL